MFPGLFLCSRKLFTTFQHAGWKALVILYMLCTTMRKYNYIFYGEYKIKMRRKSFQRWFSLRKREENGHGRITQSRDEMGEKQLQI